MRKIITILAAAAAAVGLLLTGAAQPAAGGTIGPRPPVHQKPLQPAGQITRTGIIAYDETQCSCTYGRDEYQRITSIVHSMPLVKNITSYYDSSLNTNTFAQTRTTSAGNYFGRDANGTNVTPIPAGLGLHVLCWKDSTDGSGQMDKVAAIHVVNGVSNMTIFTVWDGFVVDGVRYSDHQCA